MFRCLIAKLLLCGCRSFIKELLTYLGINDTALVLQQNRLLWYGHMLRKEDDDWVKKIYVV